MLSGTSQSTQSPCGGLTGQWLPEVFCKLGMQPHGNYGNYRGFHCTRVRTCHFSLLLAF